MNAHTFALYIFQLPEQEHFDITQEDIVHRLIHVLRVKVGETITFFDGSYQAEATVLAISKKAVHFKMNEKKVTHIPQPELVWLLPLLEREQWAEALYFLAVMGARTIVPIISQKTKIHRFEEKDRNRARRILIAASEQSKQFYIPEIAHVIRLPEATEIYSADLKLSADVTGTKLFDVFAQYEKATSILVISGPEGGFTDDEMAYLKKNNFISCTLTVSILKACHAVLVAAGNIRSWYR